MEYVYIIYESYYEGQYEDARHHLKIYGIFTDVQKAFDEKAKNPQWDIQRIPIDKIIKVPI